MTRLIFLHLLNIGLTILVSMMLVIWLRMRLKTFDHTKSPTGIILVSEIFVTSVEKMITTIIGKKYLKLTPYFLFLIMYLLIGNLLAIFGSETHFTNIMVTTFFGLITFIGIYTIGISNLKWAFFKKYKNPLEIVTQFTPCFSLTLRFFGNMLGGVIIIQLVKQALLIWSGGQFNYLFIIIYPPLGVFFDVFTVAIQTYIFLTLTLVYWGLAKNVE